MDSKYSFYSKWKITITEFEAPTQRPIRKMLLEAKATNLLIAGSEGASIRGYGSIKHVYVFLPLLITAIVEFFINKCNTAAFGCGFATCLQKMPT
jgi:hypothetical protein